MLEKARVGLFTLVRWQPRRDMFIFKACPACASIYWINGRKLLVASWFCHYWCAAVGRESRVGKTTLHFPFIKDPSIELKKPLDQNLPPRWGGYTHITATALPCDHSLAPLCLLGGDSLGLLGHKFSVPSPAGLVHEMEGGRGWNWRTF